MNTDAATEPKPLGARVDWSGVTAIVACGRCGRQWGPWLNRADAATSAVRHNATDCGRTPGKPSSKPYERIVPRVLSDLSTSDAYINMVYLFTKPIRTRKPTPKPKEKAERLRVGRAPRAVRLCDTDGCDAKHYRLRQCRDHYQANGKPDCRIDGCTTKARAEAEYDGMCKRHAGVPAAKGVPCRIDGCVTAARKDKVCGGLCLRHYTLEATAA